ncbi:MAG: hypothetical protein RLZ33_479 [Bacteroidota bacterium]|jgi:hypothetical protein
MKTKLIILSAFAFFGATEVINAQCLSINCQADTIIENDISSCDAIVNFTAPVGVSICDSISTTFTYTGAQESFIVPPGVTSITVDAYGAQGGSNSPSTNINFGGYVHATLDVIPGSTIYVNVGEQPTGLTGGWNGGGNGETAGKGGGGASDIRIGGTTLNDRVIVAGGAGGGGFWSGLEVHGGLGGGLIGGNGYRVDYASNPGGDGGTQTSSGNGTCASFNNPICAGGFGFGGSPTGCGCEVYGGGGGWWGGAGSGNCRGGGGGSSYTIPSATNVIHNQGVRVGNGEVTITYVNINPVSTVQVAGLPSGSAFPLGTTTNTFAAILGLDSTFCSFNVTIVDSIAPSISAPVDAVVCDTGEVFNLTPIALDNCNTPTITYSISGATIGNGSDDASGTSFNTGISTIWYYATDGSGNVDSTSMTITVVAAPIVSIDPFTDDTLCINHSSIILPVGTPSNGTYSGNGVAGGNFDPSLSGEGTHWIVYTYSDINGCGNSDSTSVFVDDCAGLTTLDVLNNVVLYPNPTQNQVTVSLNNQANIVTYTLHSADGKIVASGNHKGIQNFTLNLKKEEVGIYFLHLVIDGNEQVLRILKQ